MVSPNVILVLKIKNSFYTKYVLYNNYNYNNYNYYYYNYNI